MSLSISNLRSTIYDYIILKMTTQWYASAMARMPANSTVLDVGIGTASSLLANKATIAEKNLTFVGVDYDQQYVTAAEENFEKVLAAQQQQENATENKNTFLRKAQLSLVCCSIHDYNTNLTTTTTKQLFDVIYFSGSFMIIPEQAKALKHCVSMLKPKETNTVYTDGDNTKTTSPIIFTQTFENKGIVGRVVALFKPFFKYILTIDFGNATFEEDFRQVCKDADVVIDAIIPMRTTPFRREVLVLASPMVRV